MFSTRCSSCSQLISLKTDEIREAVTQAEAQNHAHYSFPCPKCSRPIKVPVKMLKIKLPRPVSDPGSETP
jgi:hypothetical protein